MASEVFLLDTNIVSHASKPRLHPSVGEWLRAQKRVAIPFAVFLEIETGIARKMSINPAKAKELRDWWDKITNTTYEYPVATPEVAGVLGKMLCCRPLTNLWFVNPEHSTRKPGQDLSIAATAIAYDLPIATTDGEDFRLIDKYFPLPGVFNPAFGFWEVPKTSIAEHKMIHEDVAV